ncbi:hypothetical protein [Tolypothrix sp. VBCCA 56010]|uniref:hypothetical protein n=1 Tax=Tolypothrix sp. VBCCA 56010 TaxID=3137731 RepID=UPI003D7DF0A7
MESGFMVATRFYRWQKAGVWNQILEHLQAIADRQGMLVVTIHYVDGTVVRAHDSRRRWKKKGNEDEAVGRTREWIQYKNTHTLLGSRQTNNFYSYSRERVTSRFFAELLMEQGAVKRSGRGRPRIRPLRLVGDKGYTGRLVCRTESFVRQTKRPNTQLLTSSRYPSNNSTTLQ